MLQLLQILVAGSAAPALRIMPLGDSITQWQCGLMQNTSTGDVASFGGYRGKEKNKKHLYIHMPFICN